ncbi:hypothetical protein TNIN_64301 [Trichonephila inaurata madagascariensis]|uniref:Uncharacterized protein n=1 Tax=Trichonephila inaurata madagascariensis TaxID=2747483 RepID=A0A8X6WN32_9ARAC|nr:hypothetical protein TNIN_64301 [Trichonephila inaurata madagascariensis]
MLDANCLGVNAALICRELQEIKVLKTLLLPVIFEKLLNEISSPKLNKEKTTKTAEGSSLMEANVLRGSNIPCEGTSSTESKVLKDSDMSRSL